MRRFLSALTFVLSLAIAVSAVPAQVVAGTLNVSGSTTVADIIMTPMKARIEAEAGVTFDLLPNGSGFGMRDLVDGRSDMAMISAPLDSTVAKMNAQDPGSMAGLDLQGHSIGESRVTFIVHPDNPVHALTLDQIGDIVTGRVTNWRDVGGADMPISIVAETHGGGLRSMVEDRLNGGRSLGGDVREFVNATQLPLVTAQFPAALGIVSKKAAAGGRARTLETDATISQPLILVTLGPVSPQVRAVIEAARAAGL